MPKSYTSVSQWVPLVSLDEMRTHRLVLRRWQEEDFVPSAAMNTHPEVMQFFPAPLDRTSSDALASRTRKRRPARSGERSGSTFP